MKKAHHPDCHHLEQKWKRIFVVRDNSSQRRCYCVSSWRPHSEPGQRKLYINVVAEFILENYFSMYEKHNVLSVLLMIPRMKSHILN